MIIGKINRNLVLMDVTFDDYTVEYLCDKLGDAIETSAYIIDMFGQMEEDFDPFDA